MAGRIRFTSKRKLRQLLRNVVVAADRMQNEWPESGEQRRQSLWRALAEARTTAEDEVYPL